ncbi:MAG: DNA-processing protein DprA [Pseudomonadota bacterium]
MLDEAGLEAWLTLEGVPGLGPQSLNDLLGAFPDPGAILAAGSSQLTPLVGKRLADAIVRAPQDAAAARLKDETRTWLAQAGNHFIPRTDTRYPSQLRDLPDAPGWLYLKGDPDWLARPMVAIVGSRNATQQGLRDAAAFAQAFSEAGLTVVSGLALGVDAAAHAGGLAGIGSSVAVVGTGLDRVYPARNRDLAHRLAAQGAIVSEFPLGTPPKTGNFPRRNRIISGLALGVLVIEAALESGSLITARQAAEQGRDVFAVPGSIHSALAKGCHRLIKQGAKLVESAQDVLEELGPRLGGFLPQGLTPTKTPASPERSADPLLDALATGPLALDQLAERLGLTVDALSVRLLSAELAGTVARLPGGLFQRIH